jgi:uncharacterized protein (TIGR02611 family)
MLRASPLVAWGNVEHFCCKTMQRQAKRVAVGIGGGFVLLAGIAMIVLPGPAFIVIPAGLAILATEFEWAQRWLRKARKYIHKKREERRAKREAKAALQE